MAKVFLDPGDTFNIVEPNVSLFGTTGTETVVIESTAMGTVLDSNVEEVRFGGNLANFQFAQLGNSVRVYDSTGTTLLVTVPLQQDGTDLTFTDQTVSATLDLTDFIIEVGNQDITTIPGTVTPKQNVTQNVSAAGSFDASTDNVTFKFTTDTYEYTIDGFSKGDILDFADTAVTPTVGNISGTDGNLTLTVVDGQDVMTINLTGIATASDGAVFNATSFETVFGAGSLV